MTVPLDQVIAHFAALQNLGDGGANLLADAQHALRRCGGCWSCCHFSLPQRIGRRPHMIRRPSKIPVSQRSERTGDVLDAEALDRVAGADVFVVLEGHTALLADMALPRLRP